MSNQLWKRELLPVWYKDILKDKWDIMRNIRSSLTPEVESPTHLSTTKETFKVDEYVVSEQTPGNFHGNEILYSSVAVGGILILLTVIVAIIFICRKKSKIADEEHGASSILVYPSQQGTAPHFLTKEIHFSLPPLRSTSMGDLSAEQEVVDSDVDSECLLLPSIPNQRSNSFSCYGLGVIEPALYRNTLDLDEIQWPEGHIGRIWFSLRYEPSTEKLLVSLLKAKNLPSRTVGTVNSCDPFVRLHLMPDERRYLQSKQKKKTCNPYFDETLVFQVSAKDMSDHTLKLTVIDGNRMKRHSEIGHVTFPLKNLEIGDGTEQQLFKLDLEKEPQEIKSQLGELLISLVYNENLNRLTASVIEAKGLKVVLILGISGACRREELTKMTVDDIEDKNSILIVKVPDTKTHTQRIFTVSNLDYIDIYRKYAALRPSYATSRRLFLKYQNKRCFNQVVGINSIGKMPSLIAKHLKLRNPDAYTGHCFRRTSATLLANTGADICVLKRHGGWKSSTVAEGYVEDSINNKIQISKKILDCEISGSSAVTSTAVDSLPTPKTRISRAESDLSGLGINIGSCTGCTINVNIVNNK